MPGSKSSDTDCNSWAVVTTACGAHGTPLSRKCAFSMARSWQMATASALGATGRWEPKVTRAAAGTFSNSVVMAELRCISCARPCSSR